MKKKHSRVKAALLAGTISVTSLGLTGCYNHQDKNSQLEEQATIDEKTICFGIGEHIISVPIEEDIRQNSYQYKFHDGYEPIGISLTAYGNGTNKFGGGTIIFSNIEEVECSSRTTNDEGDYLYLEFGTPINSKKIENSNTENIKEFGIGEHIISVPIQEDIRTDNFQYAYHEGYEVVGIATSAHGKAVNRFGGGVLLYKNTTPVKCISEDNTYNMFGIPYEVEKDKQLIK